MLSTINTCIDDFFDDKTKRAHFVYTVTTHTLSFFFCFFFFDSLLHVVCTTNYRKAFVLFRLPIFYIFFFARVDLTFFMCLCTWGYYLFLPTVLFSFFFFSSFVFASLFLMFRSPFSVSLPSLFLSLFSCSPRHPSVSVHLYLFLVRH